MAGSAMTFAYDAGVNGQGFRSRFRVVTCAWTSDSASGAVSGTSLKICGRLVKAVTVPGAGGAAPTDNYDIAITDAASNNVLTACQATLADRDTSNTEEVYFLLNINNTLTPIGDSIHPMVCDLLTVAVTNAGNSKTGTIILYLED
jgi:hypothetical protein